MNLYTTGIKLTYYVEFHTLSYISTRCQYLSSYIHHNHVNILQFSVEDIHCNHERITWSRRLSISKHPKIVLFRIQNSEFRMNTSFRNSLEAEWRESEYDFAKVPKILNRGNPHSEPSEIESINTYKQKRIRTAQVRPEIYLYNSR